MSHPVLFSFRRCPYAMRARLSLAIAAIEVEHREIVLRNKPAEMLAYSPKGTVPVLVLADATVIDESLDIMFWSLGKHCFDERQHQLIALCDGPFKAALDRYKYYSREELQQPGKSALDFRDEAVQHLHVMSDYFAAAPAPLTAFACAVLPFVRQFRNVEPLWFDSLPLAPLQQQLQQFLNAEIFARVMRKYPVWQAATAPLYTRYE